MVGVRAINMDRTVSIVRNLYKPGRWCSKHCLPSLIRFRVLQRPSPQRRRQFHSCAPLLASRMADSDIRFRATHDTINPHMKEMQYAVRGPILLKAKEIESNINKVCSRETSVLYVGDVTSTS